ncbi:VWA domain-containing protein [Nocardioides sp. JQ2195]|uniref:VWA domain-containing protein n=1 Tax=Nocardioides sp. JQ2195 TaxID=2592334 RepID=UPI00143EB2B3|nr:VWA domain-containing protein [Nocardioides sp. JQ2195]QIX26241.1 VWA domain-containing protein [Nocardioides sp. JQ2195]
MELKWSWLPLVLGAIVLVWLVIWFFPTPFRSTPRDAVLVAHAQRLRRIPRFRALARRRELEMLLRVVAVLFLIGGSIFLSSRLTSTKTHQPEVSNRDIMLCLDVSGSMTSYDEQLVREFREIAEGLDGERIGLTIWSGVAVTVFPLTDDYEFVIEQLDQSAEKLAAYDYNFTAGTYLGDDRGSLISDGLVSCVDRFDRPDEERGRAIVLASDNDPQGKPIFKLPEAADYAAEKDVVVYGLGTPGMTYDPGATAGFQDVVDKTGGSLKIMGEDGSAAEIAQGINDLEAARSKEPARVSVLDEPGTGAALVTAGVVLVVLTGIRRRS